MLLKRALLACAALCLGIASALADQSSLSAPTSGTLPGLTLVNDYNSAINAVNTCNSGASAPSNQLSGAPSAGNCWLNTSTGAVSIYDGSVWEVVGYLDATNHIWTPVIGGNAATTVASASTTNLCGSGGSAPTGGYLTISGTATIGSFGANCVAGQIKVLTFTGALTITYNSTSMILPTGLAITTAPGDVAIAVSLGSGNWRVVYFPASGAPLAAASGTVAPGAIYGLLPSSMAGTNTTASMTISAGAAADSTAATQITLASPASWAASNGNAANGYQGGTTLPNNSTIHVFLCKGGSGTTTFASTAQPATCPTGYATFQRRIFSFTTSSAGAPNPFVADEIAGGGLQAYLVSIASDVTAGANTTYVTARTLFTLSVPTGVKVKWQGRWVMTSSISGILSSPDEPDVSPSGSGTVSPYEDLYGSTTQGGGIRDLITNTSAQLGFRTNGGGGGVLYLYTTGWVDARRN